MLQTVQQGDVRADLQRQMHVGLLRRFRPAGIDDDEFGRIGPGAPIENSHPHHGLLRRDVVADRHDGVRHVDVVV